MQEHSNAVVFIGCGFPIGGVLFLAHMGVAIAEQGKRLNADIYFAAIDQEGQVGFWEVARKGISPDRMIHTPSFDSLSEKIVALAHDYAKVLVHTAGGWGQTLRIVKAKRHLPRAIKHRVTLIGTTHSYRHDSRLRILMSAIQNVMYRLYYRMVVFQCDYAAERFFGGQRLIREGRATVIPLGCEVFTEECLKTPQGSLSDDLRVLLTDNALFKFVYLAAFRPCKNHKWLISALAPVLKSHPRCRLLLCGEGAARVVNRMKVFTRRLGVAHQVIFAGRVDRLSIPYVLANSNCAVVPTKAETFGHNFLEPMFAGIPVLGTEVGVGRDIVQDGGTGFRITLKDPQSLQRAALTMLGDEELCSRMGRNARNVVANQYGHEAVAKRHVALYQRLLEEV